MGMLARGPHLDAADVSALGAQRIGELDGLGIDDARVLRVAVKKDPELVDNRRDAVD
jgi:hypothetical protein